MFTHETYLSPFAWRYGSLPMRRIWSEAHKRRLWRRIWVALAQVQHAIGLVSAEQLADLRAHQDAVDIERAHAIEAEIHHDLMAEVKCYAEQCRVGGGIIHLGATSADIEDTRRAAPARESDSDLRAAGRAVARLRRAHRRDRRLAEPRLHASAARRADDRRLSPRLLRPRSVR